MTLSILRQLHLDESLEKVAKIWVPALAVLTHSATPLVGRHQILQVIALEPGFELEHCLSALCHRNVLNETLVPGFKGDVVLERGSAAAWEVLQAEHEYTLKLK